MQRLGLALLLATLLVGCAYQAGPRAGYRRLTGRVTQEGIAAPAGARERGEISYYGAEFAGRKTANGEVFDPEAMTAAHRTLPFGTMVLVTDVATGASVVVRINDRGPFLKGRILDLSAGAARKLGMEGRGTVTAELVVK